jgi:phosphoadenylyl-sulfate reductase (thioredoxin)
MTTALETTLRAADAALADAPPLAILRWAVTQYAPRLALATAFNPEDNVLLDVVARHRLPVDVFTLDTGLLFPETRVLWQRLEARYGVTIRAVRPAQDVEAQAATHGPELWARDPDACCALRKVAPLRAALVDADAWITGLRRAQSPTRAQAPVVGWDAHSGRVKLNPLAAWSQADVDAYVAERRVPVNALHARGYPSIGCWPCTRAVAPGADPRSGRWAGTAKTECGLHWGPAGVERGRESEPAAATVAVPAGA